MASPLDALMAVLGGGGVPGSSGAPAAPGASLPQPANPVVPNTSLPPAGPIANSGPQDITVTANRQKSAHITPVGPPDTSGLDTSVPNYQITPPQPYAPHTLPQGAYDNNPELAAINQVKQGYPQNGNNDVGLGKFIPNSLPGSGTLRSLLGTVGDAFLIQSGHQPLHRQQDQANQLAQAAAGFDQDPGAAAGRIAATGVPGSIQDAQSLYTAAQNEKLREATLENTQAYRNSVLDDRTQNHQASQAIAQQKQDDRTRSLNGGILAAAASTGDQAKYTAARQAAIARAGPGSSITADEYPEDLHDFNAGYGLNANQFARNATANANTTQRGEIAAGNLGARYAGIQAGVRNTNARVNAVVRGQDTSVPGQVQALVNKQNSGQQLTPAEQAVFNHATHVSTGRGGGAGGGLLASIPGVANGQNTPLPAPNTTGFPAPSATARSPQPNANVPTHTYPSGRVIQYIGGQWKEIHH